MKMTSQMANKLLKKWQDELELATDAEDRNKMFVASIEENLEEVRPVYSLFDASDRVRTLAGRIAAIKHAVNVFNSTTECFDHLTVDQVLVLMPIYSARVSTLRQMANRSEKERYQYGSSAHIEYRYANYSVDEAKQQMDSWNEALTAMQIALDKVNQTEYGVDIPDWCL